VNFVERIQETATILSLSGDFTFSTRKDFNDVVEKLSKGGCQHLIINLEGVRFVDSAALGLLVLTHNKSRQDRWRLSLVKPQPYVEEILRLANLDRVIPIYHSEQDALALKGSVSADV
jgi:anti-anti-sigma factor